MKEKLGALAACLLFAVCFGAVGVGASWVIFGTVRDGLSARAWVRVKADIVTYSHPNVNYRYVFGGQAYNGDRLGSNVIGGTDTIDNWHDEIDGMLSTAVSEKKPITVFVNPDNPSQSMVDREIRWKLLVFALPFALGFGGVGVAALWILVRTLSPALSQGRGRTSPALSQGRGRTASSGLGTLWIVTFFWNAISFPIAMLFVPQIIESREWVGLFVLIFPIIGVLILWGAINGTYNVIRYGTIEHPSTANVKKAREALEKQSKKPKMVESYETLKEQSAAFVREEDVPQVASAGRQPEVLAQLTPEQRAHVARLVSLGPIIRKVIVWGVGIFIVYQIVSPLIEIIATLAASVNE